MKTLEPPLADQVIDYPSSPTGKGYVGVAKSPLMPVKKGFGYMGVLMQDSEREKVQCHHCGIWMKKISTFHTMKCLKIDMREYKKKYGLFLSKGLVSDKTSLALTKNCLKGLLSAEKMEARFGQKNNIQGRNGWDYSSIQKMNRLGTCPLQMKQRLYEFILSNRELPSQGNRGRSIYKILTKRYGRWGRALKEHGLPFLARKGTNMKWTFPDGTQYQYNLNRMYSREAFFNMIKEKCPVLSQKL